mmetsp:Transcript_4212/g.6709  ORF Transcript_4212/g.6709 Transcript_4212/m.6709 type:complete len:412 (+) Transcript_4212:328-1563(+)
MQIMKQKSVDSEAVKAMTKPARLKSELLRQDHYNSPKRKYCNVCKGTGMVTKTLERTLSRRNGAADEKKDAAGDEAKNLFHQVNRGGNEAKEMKEAPQEDEQLVSCPLCTRTTSLRFLSSYEPPPANDEEKFPCQICFGESHYGVSVECNHYYCKECISHSLQAICDVSQFPAYCPACRAEANGKKPEHGRIGNQALSFLRQRAVISHEFQMRFLKLQLAGAEEYFHCPSGCGNLMKDVDPTFVDSVDGKSVYVRPGLCVCGAIVCPSCHQLVKPGMEQTHECPEELRSRDVPGKATLALMAKLGKPCPFCSGFVQKNGGCNVMMCGTSAHGELAIALRNGGCGGCFLWDSGQPGGVDYFHLDGVKTKRQPVTSRMHDYEKKKEKLLAKTPPWTETKLHGVFVMVPPPAKK